VAAGGSGWEPAVPFGSRLLAEGVRGGDVAVFQRLYNALGALLARPPGPPLDVGGTFGPGEREAARAVQARFGLVPDGVVGPTTCFVLGHGTGARRTYGGPPFGSRPLREGDSGGDVWVLQNRLAVLGGLRRPADGTCGEETVAALVRWKAGAGLGASPEVDARTANALIVASLAGGRAIWSGRHGLDVAWLQRRLRECGRLAGPVDGMCSAETVTALRSFQTAAGLVPDGVAGPDTYLALGQAGPPP
jgi:peptidoglycan hydrolase-like protein with peptidoglycan-binding domain